MRKYLLIAALLCSRVTMAATPTLIACPTKTVEGSQVTASNSSFSVTPTVGNFVIIGAVAYHNLTPVFSSPTDNQSNTYAVDKQQLETVSFQTAMVGSGKIATASGTFTVTNNISPASFMVWQPCEFSGLDSTTWLDQTGSQTAGATTTITVTASGANAQSGDLVVACMTWHGAATTNAHISTPTGYTQLWVDQDEQNDIAGQCSYKVAGAETSSATWTYDLTINSSAVIATYKPATSSSIVFPLVGPGGLVGGSLISPGGLVR